MSDAFDCPARYTEANGHTRACTLMKGHDSPHNEFGEGTDFYWAQWASDKPKETKPYRGCEEEVENGDQPDDIWLDCDLEYGHAGLHHDGTVHVDWEKS